jgi:hypothetical protein
LMLLLMIKQKQILTFFVMCRFCWGLLPFSHCYSIIWLSLLNYEMSLSMLQQKYMKGRSMNCTQIWTQGSNLMHLKVIMFCWLLNMIP